MIRKISIRLLMTLCFAVVLTACSKDDDSKPSSGKTGNNNSNTPAAVSDPASLKSGNAEFSAAGTESFTFKNATATWRKSGSFKVNGRKYAETEVELLNEEKNVTISVTFFVHDSLADMFGGKLPQAGAYDFDLSTAEVSSDSTMRYAQVSIGGDSLQYYYNDHMSKGTIILTKADSGIFEGTVNLSGMTNSVFSEVDAKLNINASFKATEK